MKPKLQSTPTCINKHLFHWNTPIKCSNRDSKSCLDSSIFNFETNSRQKWRELSEYELFNNAGIKWPAKKPFSNVCSNCDEMQVLETIIFSQNKTFFFSFRKQKKKIFWKKGFKNSLFFFFMLLFVCKFVEFSLVKLCRRML